MKHLYLVARESHRTCALQDQSVAVGSDPSAALRLETGPERLCLIEPHGDSWVLKDASGGIDPPRVNGEPTLQAVLKAGDRIELGGVTWYLQEQASLPEKAVKRPARVRLPERDSSPEPTRAERPRVRARPVEVRRMKTWVPYTIAAVLVAGIALIVGLTSRIDPVDSLKASAQREMAALPQYVLSDHPERWRRSNEKIRGYLENLISFDEGDYARKRLALLPERERKIEALAGIYRDWWGSLGELERQLDPYLHAEEDPGVRALARAYRDRANSKTNAERIAWVPPGGFDPPLELDEPAPLHPRKAPPRRPEAPATTPERAPAPARADPLAGIPGERRADWQAFRKRVAKELEEGHFATALEIIRLAQSEEDDAPAAAVLAQRRSQLAATVRLRALAALQNLRDQVQGLRSQGRFKSALAKLEERVPDFPADGEFAQLSELLGEWRARWKVRSQREGVIARPEPRPSPAPRQPSQPREAVAEESPEVAGPVVFEMKLGEARTLERARHFERARGLFQELLGRLAQSDPRNALIKAYLGDVRLEEGFLAALAADIEKRPEHFARLRLKLDGRVVSPLGGGPGGLKLRFATGEVRTVAWNRIEPQDILRLFRRRGGALASEEQLAAALFFERAGLSGVADPLLAKVLKRDRGARAKIDGILARTRGEALPAGGYEWYRERWVSLAERNVLERAAEIEKLLAKLDSSDEKTRAQAFEELTLLGDSAEDALVLALRKRKEELVERLRRSKLAGQMETLAAIRTELDEKRAHALELIFDTEKYFYPYRPPACPPEKAKLYWEVQQEVDNRVAAVKKVWDDPRAVPISTATRRVVRSLHEVDSMLEEMAAPYPELDEEIPWVYGIDPQLKEAMTVRSFAWNREEAKELATSRRVLLFNAAVARKEGATAPEYAQLRITNEYRLQMGRRALAWNAKLEKAAHGHSEEMSTLGYFSHHSPTPGRRSPFDRMRLEGYTRGHSENIATNSSPDGAHHAWLHSSGHHRNILSARHVEMATGSVGRYWTQNFGGLHEYREHDMWLTLSGRE